MKNRAPSAAASASLLLQSLARTACRLDLYPPLQAADDRRLQGAPCVRGLILLEEDSGMGRTENRVIGFTSIRPPEDFGCKFLGAGRFFSAWHASKARGRASLPVIDAIIIATVNLLALAHHQEP